MNSQDLIDFLAGNLPGFNLAEFFGTLLEKAALVMGTKILIDLYQFITSAVLSIITCIGSTHDLKVKLIDYTPLLAGIQIIAGTVVTVLVVLEAIERQSGGLLTDKGKSIQLLTGRTILSVCLIYFLPSMFMSKLLEMDKVFIEMIQEFLKLNTNDDKKLIIKMMEISSNNMVSWVGIFVFIVIIVAMVGLTISLSIRTVEILIAILLAPIAAAFYVRDGEVLSTWFKETISIIFTQAMQVFLFLLSMKILIDNKYGFKDFVQGESGYTKLIIFIGIMVVAIRGPRVLRKFVYSSGAGSGVIGAGGAATRFAAMKFIATGGRK